MWLWRVLYGIEIGRVDARLFLIPTSFPLNKIATDKFVDIRFTGSLILRLCLLLGSPSSPSFLCLFPWFVLVGHLVFLLHLYPCNLSLILFSSLAIYFPSELSLSPSVWCFSFVLFLSLFLSTGLYICLLSKRDLSRTRYDLFAFQRVV